MQMDQVVFMVMPFNDEVAAKAYEHCIKGICQRRGLAVRRADEIFTANPVWDDIVGEIHRARVIIADVSGRNPNVFYELGMAHLLKPMQTVIITRDSHMDVPFDISHFRIIRYEDSIQGTKRFEDELGKTLDVILQDLKSAYSEEFTLILSAMELVDQEAVLAALIGILNLPSPVTRSDRFSIEFTKSSDSCCQGMFGGPVEENLRMLKELGYTEYKGDYVVLARKGEAFASFLRDKGWVCHYMDGTRLTPGYQCALMGERSFGPWPPKQQ